MTFQGVKNHKLLLIEIEFIFTLKDSFVFRMNANGESLIRDTDLLFLRGIVESPVIDKLKENTVQNSAKPLITNIRFVFGLSPTLTQSALD